MKIVSRQEAKQNGYKTYFTGKKCKFGHTAPRRTDNTACEICGRTRSKISNKKNATRHPFRVLVHNIRTRCKKENVPVDIDETYLKEIWTGVCPVFGSEIKYGFGSGKRAKNRSLDKRKQVASLDRIIPELGYIKGNVIFMSDLANMMKQNASRAELLQFAHWINETIN